MKKLQRSIAVALLSLMTLNSIFGTAVYAAEDVEVSQDDGELVVDDSNGYSEEVENVQPDESAIGETAEETDRTEETNATEGTDTVVEEKSTEEADAAQMDNLNYLYIEQPEQAVGDEQTIVVSWGDEFNNDNIRLSVTEQNGETVVLEPTAHNDSEYAFTYDFSQGVYHPDQLMVSEDGSEQSYDLVDAGISAYFGVGESVDEGLKSEHITLTDETAETTMEEPESYEDAVTVVDNTNIAETPENIAEALASQDVNGQEGSADSAKAKAASADQQFQYLQEDVQLFQATGNKVVVLSAGHDSRYPGAYGNGIREEEATLKIAQYCKAELQQYAGVTVLMVRTGANSGMGTNAIDDIYERVKWANSKGADAFISIHLNSASAGAYGAEVYYLSGSTEGYSLASKVQSELVKLGLYNRGVKSDEGYAVIRTCKTYGIVGIIVEHCFISNASDAANYLKTEAGLQSLGIADAKGIAAFYGLAKGGWVQSNGYWYWKANGVYQTGWLSVGGVWYYFAESSSAKGGLGAMQTGWLTRGEYTYYLNSSGQMVTGKNVINGKTYYFNSSGYLQKNAWITENGKTYYTTSDGTLIGSGRQTINGSIYYFNSDGSLMKSQWLWQNPYYYYLDENGKVVTGWKYVGSDWYYMSTTSSLPGGVGAMQKGWLNDCGHTYYLKSGGQMVKGVYEISGKKYVFNSSGYLQKSAWVTVDGKTYYAKSDGTVMEAGKQMIEGNVYYFDSDCSLMKAKWFLQNSYYFYLDANGKAVTGWNYIGADWYYMSTTSYLPGGIGAMQTGWLNDCGHTYYLLSSGQMVKGLRDISGKKYYFNSSGYMQRSQMITIDGKKYYLTADGSAAVGKVTIDNQMYFFGANGVNVTNGWGYDGQYYYYLDSKGAVKTGWLQVYGDWYYLATSASMPGGVGAMQTGWLDYCNRKYYLNKSGHMVVGLQTISGKKYYFDANGAMIKEKWMTISGKKYYFGKDGAAAGPGKVTIDGQSYYISTDYAVVNTGWYNDGKNYYYIDNNGKMTTGWLKVYNDWYYLAPSASMPGGIGAMQTGWLDYCGRTYYLNKSGQMLKNLQTISGKKYYFDANGSMAKDQWMTLSGKKYYFGKDGAAAGPGKVTIDGQSYYFNSDCTVVYSGWYNDGKNYYYLDSNGKMMTGWVKVYSDWYYLAPSASMPGGVGAMQKGWLDYCGRKYYLNNSGHMVTGYYTIDGKSYLFHADGYLLGEGTQIMGKSAASVVDQMVAYFNYSGATYPSYYKEKNTDAPTLRDFCKIYYEEATAQGIRADVAFCQAMKETGWLKYTGDVKIGQFNFAGLGATGGVPGNSFSSVRIGVRAHIQHLYAYASTENKLAYACVDTRYQYVTKGVAPYVEWLGIKENPNNKGWATSANYGYQIMDMVNVLKKL